MTNRQVYVCYIDDNGTLIKGHFELIKEFPTRIKVKSGSNIITIPDHRLRKMKESLK